jgi:hypothetical protein
VTIVAMFDDSGELVTAACDVCHEQWEQSWPPVRPVDLVRFAFAHRHDFAGPAPIEATTDWWDVLNVGARARAGLQPGPLPDDEPDDEPEPEPDEHVCCGHAAHVLAGRAGCCSPGHAAYLMATGQRGGDPPEDDDGPAA